MRQISTSIVVYQNRPDEVAAVLESVRAVGLDTLCTVVDNSPTAILGDCVRRCGAEYIFAGRNLGFGGGHNLVLLANRGRAQYHLILNPDVVFSPEVPQVLYRFMEANANIGLAMPRVNYPDGRQQHLCKLLPTPFDLFARRFLGELGESLFQRRFKAYEMRNLDMDVIREVPCLSGCFMFIRDAAVHKTGVFDGRFFMYLEDVDLCRRIGMHFKTVFYPNVAITHGYDKGSYRKVKLLTYHVVSTIRYFNKWGWLGDRHMKDVNWRAQALSPASFVDPSREELSSTVESGGSESQSQAEGS
jgi:GT2 family glycosyltransferase